MADPAYQYANLATEVPKDERISPVEATIRRDLKARVEATVRRDLKARKAYTSEPDVFLLLPRSGGGQVGSAVGAIKLSQRIQNEVRLLSFLGRETGWNGYNALPLPDEVIVRCIRALDRVPRQPNGIYPTGRESVQFVYKKIDGRLEIEIGRNEIRFVQHLGENHRSWLGSRFADLVDAVTIFDSPR